VAHVEAVVAAHHDAVRAHELDEVLQNFGGVADRVVREATEVRAEGPPGHALRLRSDALPVREATEEDRQCASGVRQAHLELRKPIEYAAEHEVGSRHRGVERIAEEVVQVEGPESLDGEDARRMQEDGEAGRLAVLEQRHEPGIAQIGPVHIRAHVDGPDTGQGGGALQLGQRALGVLHGQGGAAHEPIGIRAVRVRHGVVHRLRETPAQRSVGEMGHGRGERERVRAHADAVHHAATTVGIPVGGVERRRPRGPHHDGGTLAARAIEGQSERRAFLLDQREIRLGKEVRVHIDRIGGRHDGAIVL
jgi:hypothetical protein